ncbi:glycosyltransferase family 4 protein [Paenibacillaceae bacterium WGS1546]|uniref:glycosyltransferase family 4 protein n=1 Tax=Cohnella sp. WGS1546 TaxID=3366810 RepID=UPI00372D4717
MAPGVNLIGYARYEMGIGESCRLAARALQAAGVPFGILNYSGGNMSRSEDRSWAFKEIDAPRHPVNLFHINADQMPLACETLGPYWFSGRKNIGYWHWELPEFPDEYAAGFRHLDEVWVPSAFVRDSVSRKSPIPVRVVPHGIRVVAEQGVDRRYFGLPERKFLFLCMYDTFSYSSRKNPSSVLKAYRAAIARYGMPAGLVVKMNNPQRGETDNIRREAEDLPDVRIIDRVLSRAEANALLQCADCCVSLHRAEGFGLPLAEAMELGKPVIGTNWSGNTDFMNEDNSGAVRYRLARIGTDFGPYKAHQLWAEPDAEHAAYLMWRMVHDDGWRMRIARKGQATIRESFSPEASGRAIRERLAAI